MAEFCSCLVCGRRSAEGLPRLPGVSVMRDMHVTQADLGDTRVSRVKHAAPPRISAPPSDKYTQRQLIEAIGDALGMLRQELEAQAEGRIAALEAQIARLEMAQAMTTATAETAQLIKRLKSDRLLPAPDREARYGPRTH